MTTEAAAAVTTMTARAGNIIRKAGVGHSLAMASATNTPTRL